MSALSRQAGILLLALGAAAPAWAQTEATPPEQQFVDAPETPATAPQDHPAPAAPQSDQKARPGYLPGYRREPSVGLSPYAPELQAAMPGALTPAFGTLFKTDDWRLNFRGYLQAAARMSIGTRDNPAEGQASTTLHGDPVVPGAAYGWFDHSGTVPDPWTELNFVFGNDVLTATLSIAAWSLTEVDNASGSFLANAQLWFTNAFLTYTPKVEPVRLKLNVGVFPDRYGNMAANTQGAYGEVLIGTLNGVGATGTLELPFEGDFTLSVEAGFKGQFSKAPFGIPYDGSTDYARPEQGSTFAAHAHLAVVYLDRFTLAGHFIYSFSQDDRKDAADALPDGHLSIVGADLRADALRLGYLYFGFARVDGKNTSSLSSLVRVLNAGSGYELNERFWGFASQGNGSLTLVGGQYTLSVGKLLRHPMDFWGEGPDLSVSLFGIYGMVGSAAAGFDGKKMLKYGAEVVYSFSEFVAASMRLDHLLPDLNAPSQSYGIFSPRLILRTGWLTRESVTLQYSYYALGANAVVQGDRRLINTTSERPDRHLLAIYATTWW
jgi:hypothetical protein